MVRIVFRVPALGPGEHGQQSSVLRLLIEARSAHDEASTRLQMTEKAPQHAGGRPEGVEGLHAELRVEVVIRERQGLPRIEVHGEHVPVTCPSLHLPPQPASAHPEVEARYLGPALFGEIDRRIASATADVQNQLPGLWIERSRHDRCQVESARRHGVAVSVRVVSGEADEFGVRGWVESSEGVPHCVDSRWGNLGRDHALAVIADAFAVVGDARLEVAESMAERIVRHPTADQPVRDTTDALVKKMRLTIRDLRRVEYLADARRALQQGGEARSISDIQDLLDARAAEVLSQIAEIHHTIVLRDASALERIMGSVEDLLIELEAEREVERLISDAERK